MPPMLKLKHYCFLFFECMKFASKSLVDRRGRPNRKPLGKKSLLESVYFDCYIIFDCSKVENNHFKQFQDKIKNDLDKVKNTP